MTPTEARRMAAHAVYGSPAACDAGILHWIETGDVEEGCDVAHDVADLLLAVFRAAAADHNTKGTDTP